MKSSNCLVVYIGNGYSSRVPHYTGQYVYSVDMRENRENHYKNIYEPLYEMGYKIDTALVTNKHERYDEFVEEYGALKLNYDDLTKEEADFLYQYYAFRVPDQWGPGFFSTGARVLKVQEQIDNYEFYVFVRADAQFKKSVRDMNVDFRKMNWLWKETDHRFYNEFRDTFLEKFQTEHVFWNTYYRVSGNVLNFVPKKYFRIFTSYYMYEHLALGMMIKDLYPLITYENDVNLICGEKECFVTDTRSKENPIYIFNKKIH
jgi:hypothetical protein